MHVCATPGTGQPICAVALCANLLHNWFQPQRVCAMLLGYARVSTDEQDTGAQVAALQAAGAGRIFTERASGGRWDRPELHRMLDQVRTGDVVVVWKLDRLSRSLRDLLNLMDGLEAAGAGFRSLTEAIDTTTAAGRMMMQVIGAFAQLERDMVRERTKAGLAAAAAQGRKGGRRPKLNQEQRALVVQLVASGEKTAAEAARLFKVNASTVSRLLADASNTAKDPVP
jgi:DNA invertase Pin-like site-specific DNA recombinase